MFAKFAIATATAALLAISVGQSANAQSANTSMVRPSASTSVVVTKTPIAVPSLPSTPVVQAPAPKPAPPSVPSKPTMPPR